MSKLILNIFIMLVIATGAAWAFQKYNNPKVGYVKSQLILQDYKEMVAASDQFNGELKMVQGNLDTLQSRCEKLKAQEAQVADKDRKDWAYRLSVAQGEYEKYNQQVSEQMQSRRDELTKKVLANVNDFIQKYGKDNNYKLILGTTDDGSILYGREGDDLTDVILSQLNDTYAAKSKDAK